MKIIVGKRRILWLEKKKRIQDHRRIYFSMYLSSKGEGKERQSRYVFDVYKETPSGGGLNG